MYQRKDAFYTRAKASGYRSRAAFKLEQLAQRAKLFRRGDCVVDLGAWPGGWLQVAARAVGPGGKVIGIDLQAIEPLPEPNVVVLTGDIGDSAMRQRLCELCGGRADVVLSDLAPKLTGVRARDQAAAQGLADQVLEVAQSLLSDDGRMVVKLFMGADLTAYTARVRSLFRTVHISRPPATRKGSAEIYAVALGYRARESN